MKKKWYVVAVGLLAACGVLFANGQVESKETTGAGELQSMNLIFSHPDVVDAKLHSQGGAEFFKNYIEKASDGKITVTIQGGGSLGSTEDLMNMVMNNTVPNHISIGHTEGTLSQVFPDIEVITIPYLFKTVDEALSVMDGAFGDKLYQMMNEKTGIKVLGMYDNSFRNFISNKRPIRSPEDMKGLKIRVMAIKSHQAIVTELGAIPVVVPWTELYTALQTGVVDGAENSLGTLVLGSLQEVNKYLVLDKHVFSMVHMICNDSWFNSLPEANKKLIAEAAEAACVEIRKMVADEEIKAMDTLGAKVEIYDPTDAELNAFRNAIQAPVTEIIRKEIEHPALADEIIAEVENYRKSH